MADHTEEDKLFVFANRQEGEFVSPTMLPGHFGSKGVCESVCTAEETLDLVSHAGRDKITETIILEAYPQLFLRVCIQDYSFTILNVEGPDNLR